MSRPRAIGDHKMWGRRITADRQKCAVFAWRMRRRLDRASARGVANGAISRQVRRIYGTLSGG